MRSSRREFLKQASAFPLLALGWRAWQGSASTAELARYDALGLAELVRKREITPLELVEDVLLRVRQVNPEIHAVLTALFDTEKARARARGSLAPGPLSGVPVLLKNLIDYRGAKIDFGSRLYARALERGVVPLADDSPLAEAVEDAGMIVAGITNSAELGLIDTTEPVLHEVFMNAFIGLWASSTSRLEPLVAQWLGDGTKPEDVLEPWTMGLLRMAKERGPGVPLLEAFDVFTRASARLEALFQDFDVMLSPVLRLPPYRLGYHDPCLDFDTLLGRVVDAVAYTPLQNATGTPGMSVPLHWTADGLPVGSHFSAWRGGEKTLLQLAYELEEARPWSQRVPPIAVR